MATTLELIQDLTASQTAYAGAVVSKFAGVKTALDTKASLTYVDGRFSQIVGLAPETLDTLAEVATRIAADSSTVGALSAEIALRPTAAAVQTLIDSSLAGFDPDTTATSIATLMTITSGLNTSFNALEATVSNLDGSLSNTTASTNDAINRLNALDSVLGDYDGAAGVRNKALNTYQSVFIEAEPGLPSLISRSAMHTSAISTLQVDVATLQSTKANNSDVVELTQLLATMATDLKTSYDASATALAAITF